MIEDTYQHPEDPDEDRPAIVPGLLCNCLADHPGACLYLAGPTGYCVDCEPWASLPKLTAQAIALGKWQNEGD